MPTTRKTTTRKKASTQKPRVSVAEIKTEAPIEMPTPKPSSSSRIFSFFKSINTTRVLVALLVIASFMVGMLYNKVQDLERNNSVLGTTAGQPPQPSGPPAKVNVSNGHFPIKGNDSAKVTIVEFADFRCPYCKQFYTDTETQILKDYVNTGKVKFAFRQFPFLGPASTVAANAAECANDQNKFWDFHDYMYSHQPDESDTSMYNTDSLTTIAQSLGMDADQFRSCLDGKKNDAKASSDYSDGQKAGVSGTPAFFVNGTPLEGALPYAQFKSIIDTELKKS